MGIQWGPDLMAFRPYVFAEPFVGYQIEDWEGAFELAKAAGRKLKDVRVVGWDIARSSDKGWQIIEGNAYGMFNVAQVATQKGMRREFLDEIRWSRYKD